MVQHEFAVLEAEQKRGWVVLVKTHGMIAPVGPRLLRGADMDPKFLKPFHPTRRDAEEARAAWESYQNNNHAKPNKKQQRQAA